MDVCQSCFGESAALQRRFDERGVGGCCPTCGAEKVQVLDAGQLSDLFEGLKDYYEPLIGDRYPLGKDGVRGLGPDTGDDSLVEILRESWDVFSDAVSDEKANEILESVFHGYIGEYMRRGADLWREVSIEWDRLKQYLKHEWRFFETAGPTDNAFVRTLDAWVEALGSQITCRRWYRARIQDSREARFGDDTMGAPAPEKARAGRANSSGIPHLYVASDERTAVSEVRAEPGEWVTLATVEIVGDDLRVLDLTRVVRIVDPFATPDLHQALMVREFLNILSYELSRPVRPDDHEIDYVATQFLSEYFRKQGLSGIVYPSALAEGTNAVFFDPTIGRTGDCEQRFVWSKALDIVDPAEFERRDRKRRGYGW
ncbi:MAG: RES family NAD+ phosphorylase [Planctomycetota bacterium]|nr:RES family NAD+ phosphorylase [Planctomycetota bacterium]